MLCLNVCTGLKMCPYILDNAGLRAAVRNVGESPLFFVAYKNCRLARFVKAANLVCCELCLFFLQQAATILKQILY